MSETNVAKRTQADNRDVGRGKRTQLKAREAPRSELEYFRHAKYLPALAAVIGLSEESAQLDRWHHSILQCDDRSKDRGCFILTNEGWLRYVVCRFKEGNKKPVSTKTYELPRLYAMVNHAPEELSNLALLLWTRRLLYYADLLHVRRTKFCTPVNAFADLLRPKGEPGKWHVIIAVVDLVGLLVDLHDDRAKRWVPFAGDFGPSWCWEHFASNSNYRWSDRKEVQAIISTCLRLACKCALLRYKKEIPWTTYRPRELGLDDVGMSANELRQHHFEDD